MSADAAEALDVFAMLEARDPDAPVDARTAHWVAARTPDRPGPDGLRDRFRPLTRPSPRPASKPLPKPAPSKPAAPATPKPAEPSPSSQAGAGDTETTSAGLASGLDAEGSGEAYRGSAVQSSENATNGPVGSEDTTPLRSEITTAAIAVYTSPEHEPVEARAELVFGPDLERAASYAAESKSRNTRRAYAAQLRGFAAWCADRGFSPLPALPHVVASFIAYRADRGVRPSTLAIFLAALAAAHKAAGEPNPRQSPVVESTWLGIRRTKGVAPTRKSPVLPTDLRAMVATLDGSTLIGKRDAAILALGFCAALRRSEIVALDVADLSFTEEGLVITIRRSKCDQEGVGQVVGVAFAGDAKVCPVRRLRAWLDAAEITSGPVFVRLDHGGKHRTERLHDRGVARIVKRLAGRAGMDATRYSGHSLRAGHATSAYKAGKSILAIQRQGRWASASMVTSTYIREIELFEDNSSAGLL